MTIFKASGPPLAPPPDDLTVPQFLLDIERPIYQDDTAENIASPCLIDEDSGRKVYLEELRYRTDYLSRALTSRDIGNGDIVAICSPNHIDYPVCIWAAHCVGGIVATISPSLTVEELVHHLRIAPPSLLFVHSDCLENVEEACAVLRLDHSRTVVLDSSPSSHASFDNLLSSGQSLPAISELRLRKGEGKTKVAFLSFSSGTTGVPKAVAISHYNLICNVLQAAAFNHGPEPGGPPRETRRFRAGDACTSVIPFYHIYGLVVNMHVMLHSRMTIVVSKAFNFEKFLGNISKYKMTCLFIVPPQAVLLCKHPAAKGADLSSVRFCLVSAAPVSAELQEELLKVMPDIQLGQGYGMTEACAGVSIFPPSPKVGTLGSAGQLLPGTSAKVVKADGSLATFGEPGELYIRGGQVALGYYQNEKATRETFVDGWLRTGDEVVFRPNGDIFVVDRIKELIKVKGFQVAPAELEGHLLKHPDVADAGVIGIADDYSGEIPLAFVVLRPSLLVQVKSDEKLAENVRARLMKHVSDNKSKSKWLTGGIVFTDSLPKSPSGKILRRVLRDQARNMRVPAGSGVKARL